MPRRQVTYSNHPNHRARMVHAQGERQFRTYDTSHIRPRKSKGPVIVGIVLAIVVVLALVFGVSAALKGCSGDNVEGSAVVVQSTVSATIPDGSSASDTASILQSAGVVPDSKAFLSRAKTMGLDSKFQAGTYTFSSGMTLDDVVKAVASGDFGTVAMAIQRRFRCERVRFRIRFLGRCGHEFARGLPVPEDLFGKRDRYG